jgi:hemerythrin-like domain-containing protein
MAINTEPLADIREMYMVHTVFRREFGLAPDLVRGVADGDTERTQAVAAHLELLSMFLHHHHSGEDNHLWPRLLQRGGAEAAPVVLLMESQHEAIETTGAEVDAALASWQATASVAARDELADTLERLLAHLGEHMALEEDQALPLIAEYITAAEWGAMVQEGGADVPQETMPMMFGMMMYEGDPEVVRLALSMMPPEVQGVMGDLAKQAYATHCEQVHGTSSPARIGAR